jgi:hypothetical protein
MTRSRTAATADAARAQDHDNAVTADRQLNYRAEDHDDEGGGDAADAAEAGKVPKSVVRTNMTCRIAVMEAAAENMPLYAPFGHVGSRLKAMNEKLAQVCTPEFPNGICASDTVLCHQTNGIIAVELKAFDTRSRGEKFVTIVNRNGIEGATTAAMTMRCDELGKPFEPGTFGVSEANENTNRNLAGQGMKRKGTRLFVVRADGGLTVVIDKRDLFTGWASAPPSRYVDGTMGLHLAIRLHPPAGATAKGKKGKKEWDARGSGTGVDYDDDDDDDDDEGEGEGDDFQSFHAKRRRVNVFVEAFWRRMGWAPDAGLMAYHTQHICKNKVDMAEALENKEVTTVPRKWPYDREPQPLRHAAAAAAASSSSSSSTTSETPGEALALRLQVQMMQQMIQQQQQQQAQVIPNTPGAPAAPADKEYPAAPATAAPTPQNVW